MLFLLRAISRAAALYTALVQHFHNAGYICRSHAVKPLATGLQQQVRANGAVILATAGNTFDS